LNAPLSFGPYVFCLTDAEARTGAARLALRRGLVGAFERHFVAPLAVFVLLLVFISIVAFTGLVGRRFAETALILAAILFMAARFHAHWRLRGAQKASLAAAKSLQGEGEMRLVVDDGGVSLEGPLVRRCGFASRAAIEDAGGMIYFWPEEGEPFFVPTRAFGGDQNAAAFLAYAQAHRSV
jgi:hypothetical protein